MTFKSIYRQLHTARNLDFCSKIQIFDRERDSHGPISLKIVVVLVGTFVVN